jgi:hypothetical protein
LFENMLDDAEQAANESQEEPAEESQDQAAEDPEEQAVEDPSIIRYPAVVSFPTPNEGAASLAYGTLLEWRYSQESHDAICGQDHEIAFMCVASQAIVATIRFTMPYSNIAECFRLKEGTDISITFAPDRSAASNVNCSGIHVAKAFNLPVTTPLFLLVRYRRLCRLCCGILS